MNKWTTQFLLCEYIIPDILVAQYKVYKQHKVEKNVYSVNKTTLRQSFPFRREILHQYSIIPNKGGKIK